MESALIICILDCAGIFQAPVSYWKVVSLRTVHTINGWELQNFQEIVNIK